MPSEKGGLEINRSHHGASSERDDDQSERVDSSSDTSINDINRRDSTFNNKDLELFK
jgi:hypothetical protein